MCISRVLCSATPKRISREREVAGTGVEIGRGVLGVRGEEEFEGAGFAYCGRGNLEIEDRAEVVGRHDGCVGGAKRDIGEAGGNGDHECWAQGTGWECAALWAIEVAHADNFEGHGERGCGCGAEEQGEEGECGLHFDNSWSG